MAPPRYAELRAKSCFSFLEGASHPEELVARASELGLAGLALADVNGLYGIVRGHAEAKRRGLPLVVIGEGPERKRLEARAASNVKLVGWQSDAAAASLIGRARAFVHAAEEDFGLVMAEAQTAGCPVIGYARGAAREIMIEGETGLLFQEQSVEGITEAVRRFEDQAARFKRDRAVENARRFGKQRFQQQFASMVEREWQAFAARRAVPEAAGPTEVAADIGSRLGETWKA